MEEPFNELEHQLNVCRSVWVGFATACPCDDVPKHHWAVEFSKATERPQPPSWQWQPWPIWKLSADTNRARQLEHQKGLPRPTSYDSIIRQELPAHGGRRKQRIQLGSPDERSRCRAQFTRRSQSNWRPTRCSQLKRYDKDDVWAVLAK